MTCTFDTSKIQDYIDNMLSPEEREDVEKHLASCPECHREWVEMENLTQLLGSLPMVPLPEGFEEELHERLLRERAAKRSDRKVSVFSGHIRKHLRAYSAAAAVLVIGVASVGFLNGMNGTKEAALEKFSVSDSAAPAAPAPMMESAQNFSDAGAAVQRGAGEEISFTAADEDMKNKTVQDRKVIRSGSASLNTVNYDQTVKALTDYAEQSGGYVENLYTGKGYSPYEDGSSLRSGSITLRVPAGKFDGFFALLEGYGVVSDKSMSAEDISMQYRDTYNQAVNLEIREAKLREIMGQAKTVQDVMAVEVELSRVRGEINQLKGTLQQWDALVDLSRVTVNLTEVRSLETKVSGIDVTLPGRIKLAFVKSLNHMVAFFETTLVWMVSGLPWIATAAVLGAIVWRVVRKRRTTSGGH